MTSLPTNEAEPAELKKSLGERRSEMQEGFYHHTDSITQISRYIGYGLIAAYYTIKSQPDPFTSALNILCTEVSLAAVLTATGVFGVLSILLDYLQHVFFARTFQVAMKDKRNRFKYNRKSKTVRAATVCFYLKQISAIFGSGCLVVLILNS